MTSQLTKGYGHFTSQVKMSQEFRLAEQGWHWHSGPRELTGISHLFLVVPGFLPFSYFQEQQRKTKNKKTKKKKKKHNTPEPIFSKRKICLKWHPLILPISPSHSRTKWNPPRDFSHKKKPLLIYGTWVAAPSTSSIPHPSVCSLTPASTAYIRSKGLPF